jgi:hypothetical protein
MITNFEEITQDLTSEEKSFLKSLIRLFKEHSVDNPIKEPQVLKEINFQSNLFGKRLGGPRLRKLCNLIRSRSIIPLIATSKGYYVSYDQNEIEKQIKSLVERAEAILSGAEGMEKFLKKKKP